VTRSHGFRAILCALLMGALLLSALSCGSSTQGAKAKPDAGSIERAGKGYRFESNGWIYLHIEGGPYERGFQHGKLMAKEMDSMRKALTHFYYNASDLRWPHVIEAAKQLFAGKLTPEIEEEIRGISEGAKTTGVEIPVAEVLALNGFVEITGYWWPNVKSGKLPDIESTSRCSAFVATGKYTSDGGVVMAHNTWSSYVEAQHFNVMLDIVPENGHRMFMQSAPGLVYSAMDFFVTDARIMGTETTISGIETFDTQGIPEFVRARNAMQYAGTLDEFVSIMRQGNNGSYANSWLLADARSGEIMRFEQGLKEEGLERTKSGYFVGFNGPSDPDLRNLESTNSGYFNIKDSVGARRVRLETLMKDYKGKLDVGSARTIIADHYDVYLKKNKPGVRTVEGRSDLDDRKYSTGNAYSPSGAVDGKVMDSREAMEMSFQGRWGSSSGLAFDAEKYLEKNPQFAYLKGYLLSRPTEPWTCFKAGM